MWIDAHCHLQLDAKGSSLSDLDIRRASETVDRAVAQAVDKLVCVGTDAETSASALQLAKLPGERVFATVGLHPHDAKQGMSDLIDVLNRAIINRDNRLVAIGECGLDYFYEHSPREIQRKCFSDQVALAKEHDLALVIHTRDAWDDTFSILRSEGVPPRTVIHCFTGGVEEMRIALDLGLYLSFSGIVTFPKSTNVQAAAHFCPPDRMMIETDSPFLTPVPHRGRPNEPANVSLIGKYLARMKEFPVEEFAGLVSKTTKELFNLH